MFTLNIPTTMNALMAWHIPIFTQEKYKVDKFSPSLIFEFVAEMAGLKLRDIEDCDARDIAHGFTLIQKAMAELNTTAAVMSNNNPPKQIKIDGHEFQLVDLSRPSVGFVVDYAAMSGKIDALRLAAMCYIPKGSVYGETKEHEIIKHPIDERIELFRKHYTALDYMVLNTFFLRSFKSLATSQSLKKKAKMTSRQSSTFKNGSLQ
jgi:hypothetical protein